MKTLKAFFIRSKTNDGDFAKQYIFHTLDKYRGKNIQAIIIQKRVLIKTSQYYRHADFRMLKKYKNMLLVEKIFSIKPNTLKAIVEELFNQNIK